MSGLARRGRDGVSGVVFCAVCYVTPFCAGKFFGMNEELWMFWGGMVYAYALIADDTQ